MTWYAKTIKKNNSKNFKKLREEYIESNKAIWKERAMPYVVAREVSRFTTNEIGNMIGTSESVIKKFEKGEPIDRNKLVTQSYVVALNLIYISKYGLELDNVNKIYSPVELLERLVKLNSELGVALIKDAVNVLNLSYNLDLEVYVDKIMNEFFRIKCDTEIIVYEKKGGKHVFSFVSKRE